MALPTLVEWVVAALAGPEDAESILADLEVERAERSAAVGQARGRRWLWRQVGRSVPSLLTRRLGRASRGWRTDSRLAYADLGLDLRHAVRRLRRSPGFAGLAVGLLGLGIGASTAIFSLSYTIWLKPLPYTDPARLVSIQSLQTPTGFTAGSSGAEMADVRARIASFVDVAGFHYGAVVTTVDGEPVRLVADPVSTNLFAVLGVTPALGRAFRPDDAGQPRVVVSDAAWRARFDRDPGIIGRRIENKDHPLTIIGVMPRGFRFPLGLEADLWVPSVSEHDDRASRFTDLVARLKPGATLERANVELTAFSAALARALPATNARWTLGGHPLGGGPSPAYRAAFGVLLGIVGLFLAIACANLASLLVARHLDRRGELTLMLAIGASRGRLARALLIESTLLAVAGGLVAVVLIAEATHLFRYWLPPSLPRLDDLSIDRFVFAIAMTAAVVTAVLCTLAPIAGLGTLQLSEALSGARIGGPPTQRGPQLLVIVEIALAAVLVIGASAMVHSFDLLLGQDRGYVPSGVATMTVTLPFDRFRDQPASARVEAVTEMLASVASLPGVVAAGGTTGFPGSALGSFGGGPVNVPGRQESPVIAVLHTTTPGYFRAMGVALKKGRSMTAADTAASWPVAVISEALERQLWPDGRSLGQRLEFARAAGMVSDGVAAEVVGVVADLHLRGRPSRDVFVPFSQAPAYWLDLVVRTAGDPAAMATLIRQAVRRASPAALIEHVSPLETIISDAYGLERSQSFLTALVAALGGLVSLAGLFALLNQYVGRRTREMGIRLALGASPGRLCWQIFGRGMRLSTVGLTIGVGLAILATRILRNHVFGLATIGPGLLVAGALGIALACAAVIAVSARRIVTIDPIASIRQT